MQEVATKLNVLCFERHATDEEVARLAANLGELEVEELAWRLRELGGTNNPAAVPHVVAQLSHDDSFVRAIAASSLGMLGAMEQFAALGELYENDRSNTVQLMALKSIGDIPTPEAQAFLREVKESERYKNRLFAEVVDLFL